MIIKRMKQSHTRRGEIDDLLDDVGSIWKKFDKDGNEIIEDIQQAAKLY